MGDTVAQELALWQRWVLSICRHFGHQAPTAKEWDTLILAWHPGKKPLVSVCELEDMRPAMKKADA